MPAAAFPAALSSAKAGPAKRRSLRRRQIDRPIRPLFPDGFRNETQVIALVFSADKENDPDVIGINAAAAARGAVGHSVRRDGWRGARGARERRVRGEPHLRRARNDAR